MAAGFVICNCGSHGHFAQVLTISAPASWHKPLLRVSTAFSSSCHKFAVGMPSQGLTITVVALPSIVLLAGCMTCRLWLARQGRARTSI